MAENRNCTYCNVIIKCDAFSCPCGVFYQPGCINLAVNKSTGKRKCCSHKPPSRSLSPNTSGNITVEQISEMLTAHYAKAKEDSEKFIGNKLDVVEEKISGLSTSVSAFSDVLDGAVESIENLEC